MKEYKNIIIKTSSPKALYGPTLNYPIYVSLLIATNKDISGLGCIREPVFRIGSIDKQFYPSRPENIEDYKEIFLGEFYETDEDGFITTEDDIIEAYIENHIIPV